MALWDKITGRSLPPKPRPNHYIFAHKVLPAHLWQGDSVLGILANPENQDFTIRLWDQISESLPAAQRLAPDGLRHASHWIGGQHLVILIELPLALVPGEAKYVAITTSPTVSYYTLEASGWSGTATTGFMFCGWTQFGHVNYGSVDGATVEDFLRAICRRLSVPETIDAPLPEQESGMSKGGGLTISGAIPAELPPEQLAQVTGWTVEAEEASRTGDHERAEQLYRAILAYRMQYQGPDNTLATLVHMQIVQSLLVARRYKAAEQVSRDWWKLCRRHRMLGHTETMLAIRWLKDCLLIQHDSQQARELAEYGALLAGLARGTNSPIAVQARMELQRATAP